MYYYYSINLIIFFFFSFSVIKNINYVLSKCASAHIRMLCRGEIANWAVIAGNGVRKYIWSNNLNFNVSHRRQYEINQDYNTWRCSHSHLSNTCKIEAWKASNKIAHSHLTLCLVCNVHAVRWMCIAHVQFGGMCE